MSTNDVIDAYVGDVVRRLPRAGRNEIGFELRQHLVEMLAERAEAQGRDADDAMVLNLLREFGAPAEVAARYAPPGPAAIPAEKTRSFAIVSLVGIGLQWALTLPAVFQGQSLAGWWLTWGLGAFWWPGLVAMLSLAEAWLRHAGWIRPAWRPRVVDPDRVERGPTAFGLATIALGAAFMIALPWLARLMPAPLPQVFAFDPEFLRARAAPVVLLWAATFVVRAVALSRGRWTAALRRVDLALSLAFVGLLVWWLLAGPIFQAPATDAGAKGAIGLVLFFIALDLGVRAVRRRPRLRAPKVAA
jgi:hypothetical protein